MARHATSKLQSADLFASIPWDSGRRALASIGSVLPDLTSKPEALHRVDGGVVGCRPSACPHR